MASAIARSSLSVEAPYRCSSILSGYHRIACSAQIFFVLPRSARDERYQLPARPGLETRIFGIPARGTERRPGRSQACENDSAFGPKLLIPFTECVGSLVSQ